MFTSWFPVITTFHLDPPFCILSFVNLFLHFLFRILLFLRHVWRMTGSCNFQTYESVYFVAMVNWLLEWHSSFSAQEISFKKEYCRSQNRLPKYLICRFIIISQTLRNWANWLCQISKVQSSKYQISALNTILNHFTSCGNLINSLNNVITA